MTNIPKILWNNLDQVPESWQQYDNELNNPKVHNEIIGAFDKHEKKESKEITKSLDFEDHLFKIDSSDNDLWEDVYAEQGRAQVKIKIKKTWDVVEYLDLSEFNDSPIYHNNRAWRQVFVDYNNLINYIAENKDCSIEDVEKEYLITEDELKWKINVMTKDEYESFYTVLFNNCKVPVFSWETTWIYDRWFDIYIWLSGGKVAMIGMDKEFAVYNSSDLWDSLGYGAILLKN